MKSKRLQFIGFTILLLLLIPLVAMQFTSEVNWTLSDFVVGGMLLFGTGIICELVIRKVKKKSFKIIICMFVLLVFLLIWAELAVGLF